MKKVLLLISLFYSPFFISNNINAAENKLLKESDKIEFNKCYNYQIASEEINCSNERISLKVDQLYKDVWSGAEYQCDNLPLDFSGLRGDGNYSSLKDLKFLLKIGWSNCDVWYHKQKNASKIDDCLEKYGKSRRQKCFDKGNFILYKPIQNISIFTCENKSLNLRTSILSLDNKQSCNNLNEFNSGWKQVEFFSTIGGKELYEYILYMDYIKNPPDKVIIQANTNKDINEENVVFCVGSEDYVVLRKNPNDCPSEMSVISKNEFCNTKFDGYHKWNAESFYEEYCNEINGVESITEEKQIAKEKRKEKEEEEKRIAEAKKKKEEKERKEKEEEEKRIAEEKRKAKEEEEKRIAEAKKKEEEAKQAQEEELYVIGSGTGFFVNDEGYVVTNEHVAGICQSLASYINGKTHIFNILALDNRNDLALLRGEYRNKNFLNINPLGAEFGQDIMAFGFPLAENLSSSVKLTRGIVSSLSGPENDISLIQIDAAIQPGNSGGPVLNYNGQVVGVASSGLNKVQMLLDEESPYIPENVNFAVAATTLTGFLKSNSVKIFNESFDQKSSQELAKIGMPPTIQLHCLNTIAAHNQLRESENYNDVLLKKVVNLK